MNYLTINNPDEILTADMPMSCFGWEAGMKLRIEDVELSGSTLRLWDGVFVYTGPVGAFDFDEWVAHPPHTRDTDEPCFACGARWVGRHINHDDECAYIQRLDALTAHV